MSHIPSFLAKAFDDVPMPASGEHAEETLRKLAATTRRALLRGGLTAAVPAMVLGATSTGRAGTRNRPLPSYTGNSTLRYFQEIQVNEASHVQIVIGAIRSLGGTPRPYPTFQGIDTADAGTLLRMATMFENTGVGAYFGAAPFIQNPAVANVATSLALVEAYQSGFLNTLSNQPMVPGGLTYAVPATIPQVVAAVQPFIVSLNDNGLFPPTFGTTPSPENDIAILNFALILEFLEATFYFNSVPKVFAGNG